jgi:hypothetical protein
VPRPLTRAVDAPDDTTRLTAFVIRIVPPQTTAFEIWIDDVSFVR